MKWGRLAIIGCTLMAGFGLPSAGDAAPRRDAALEARLMEHIQVLASDEMEGRQPGTDGEAKTLRYLAREWFGIGLVSGTNAPANEWFTPVTLIAREPASSSAAFLRRDRRQYVPRDAVLMLTSGRRSMVRDAPLLFVGDGRTWKDEPGALPSRNELAGRVALLLDAGIDGSERQNALLAAGASAVLTVLDGDRTLESVAARRRRSGYALKDDSIGGDLEGFITREGLAALFQGSARTLAKLEQAAAASDFVPQLLDITATLEATTNESEILTHNLIGKLPGRRPETGAVLFLAHWDGFGFCGEPPADDVICNGAIDNASGLAVLTEIARALSRERRPFDRDIYFLATTAEELGLLGAHAFAENPPLPLGQIVAAFNIDSFAIAPAGTPLGIVGSGMTRLDPQIAAVARQERRKIVPGDAANAYVRRQDGWALQQHDIPAVMVTSAYGDLSRLEAFFESNYHRPHDDLSQKIELGGAAEDVAFHIALARWFADPRRVPIPAERAK
jgi:hypothetical protein